MKAAKFYITPRYMNFIDEVDDIPRDELIDWIKISKIGNLQLFERFLQETTAHISFPPKLTREPICDNAGLPNPKALTSDAVFKIINLQGVKEGSHSRLSSVYDALKYIATSDDFEDCQKGVWSTVVLQITGKRNLGELEFSNELLEKIVQQNRLLFGSTRWSRRAVEFRSGYSYNLALGRKLIDQFIVDDLLPPPKMTPHKAEDKSLSAKFDSLNAQVNSVNAEVKCFKAVVKSVNAEVKSLKAEITSFKAEAKSLRIRIENLERVRVGDPKNHSPTYIDNIEKRLQEFREVVVAANREGEEARRIRNEGIKKLNVEENARVERQQKIWFFMLAIFLLAFFGCGNA